MSEELPLCKDVTLPMLWPAMEAAGKCRYGKESVQKSSLKGKDKIKSKQISVIQHDHLRFEHPVLGIFGIEEGKEASRLKKAAGLNKVAQGFKDNNVRYILHQEYRPVSLPGTRERWDPSKFDTQDAKTTIEKGGGDCDDLAVLYAYELLAQSKNPDLEFGVIHGFLKMQNGMCMPHAVLVLRNKRKPNTYHLYEVTNIRKGPEYVGHTDFNKGLYYQKEAASPEGNPNFLMNSYVPVKPDGTLDFSRKAYFRP